MRLKQTSQASKQVTARDVIEMAGVHDDEASDIAYCQIESPVGTLLAAASRVGLVTLSYEDHADETLKDLSRWVPGALTKATTRLDEVRLQLDEYFAGKRTDFDLPIDWALVKGYARDVLKATAEIPFGQVMSYAQVAAATGREKAVRAAGNALGSNPIPIVIPCHRVVRSDGTVGGYTGGLDKKLFLLGLEGVKPKT